MNKLTPEGKLVNAVKAGDAEGGGAGQWFAVCGLELAGGGASLGSDDDVTAQAGKCWGQGCVCKGRGVLRHVQGVTAPSLLNHQCSLL